MPILPFGPKPKPTAPPPKEPKPMVDRGKKVMAEIGGELQMVFEKDAIENHWNYRELT